MKVFSNYIRRERESAGSRRNIYFYALAAVIALTKSLIWLLFEEEGTYIDRRIRLMSPSNSETFPSLLFVLWWINTEVNKSHFNHSL